MEGFDDPVDAAAGREKSPADEKSLPFSPQETANAYDNSMRNLKRTLAREQRLILLFKTLGENMKTYGNDLQENYITGPYHRRDVIQKGLGPVMAAGSIILEGPDQVWAGIVDQKLERPSGIAGRTRRDLKLLLKNVATVHPLRAFGDVFRLGFSDLPLDAGDAIGGFHSSENSYHMAA